LADTYGAIDGLVTSLVIEQIQFSENSGTIEPPGTNTELTKIKNRRLSLKMNNVSNLDKNNIPLAKSNQNRIFSLGNRLWHSDASLKKNLWLFQPYLEEKFLLREEKQSFVICVVVIRALYLSAHLGLIKDWELADSILFINNLMEICACLD
jgi:hypothetical protein